MQEDYVITMMINTQWATNAEGIYILYLHQMNSTTPLRPCRPQRTRLTFSEETLMHMEVNLHTLIVTPSTKSMKFKGRVNGQAIYVIFDTSATSNFIGHQLANELKFTKSRLRGYHVIQGTGDVVSGCEVCTYMRIDLYQLTIQQPLLVLPVANCDIILGLFGMTCPHEIN